MRYKYIAYKYMGNAGVERLFHGMWESYTAWAAPAATIWRPPTDVYETRNELVVMMELAGVSDDDVTVTLFSDHLVVEGYRRQPDLSSSDACHQLGIKYGEFRSVIFIPFSVEHDSVTAEYSNGMLKIILPKLRR